MSNSYIRKNDIQTKVSLENIGGFNWKEFPNVELSDFFAVEQEPEIMNDVYWAWKTAVNLSDNTLNALYRPNPDSEHLIAEFTVPLGNDDEGLVVVSLSNIGWGSIPGDDPVGFYDAQNDEDRHEYNQNGA